MAEEERELSEVERNDAHQKDWDEMISGLDERDAGIFNERYGHLARTGAMTNPDYVPEPEEEREISQARRWLASK